MEAAYVPPPVVSLEGTLWLRRAEAIGLGGCGGLSHVAVGPNRVAARMTGGVGVTHDVEGVRVQGCLGASSSWKTSNTRLPNRRRWRAL